MIRSVVGLLLTEDVIEQKSPTVTGNLFVRASANTKKKQQRNQILSNAESVHYILGKRWNHLTLRSQSDARVQIRQKVGV